MAVSKEKRSVPSGRVAVSRGAGLSSGLRRFGRGFSERKSGNTDLAPSPKKADVHLRIERKNIEMRARYLRTADLYTAEDIQGPSTKWKREGRVFAIKDDEKDLFPAFQFADGKPLPIIKEILEALPDYLSPWQIAFWFESGNGWLGGKTPQKCLKNKSKVIDAAEQLGNPAVG